VIAPRRQLGFSGLLIFAAAFFLPPGYYNSPLGRFSWSWEAIFLAESAGEKLAFIAICLAIAYPYLWALATAVGILFRSPGRPAVISQFICHLVGAVPITALGWTLILLRSDFPDRSLQWLAALAPAAFLLLLGAAVKISPPPRRFPALVFPALLLFAPLQLILGYYVGLDGGAWWGFLLGGAGALIALLGIGAGLLKPGSGKTSR
jgi:hypothetical protein